MDNIRFEDLMSRLLDEELSSAELSELAALIHDHPERQLELQSQLETADLLAQAKDELRTSSLFVAAVDSRLDEDPFVKRVQSAISTGMIEPRSTQAGFRIARWQLVAGIAAVLVLLVSVFFLRPDKQETVTEIAKITGLSGSVLWTGDGGRLAEDLVVGANVSGGTVEGMTPESWVELTFRDGSTVTISGNSMLTFSDHDQKLLRLKEGNFSANVKPQPKGRPMLVHTRSATFEVLGTKFEVEASLASTTLNVSEGQVRAKRLSDGRTVDVPAKHRVTASTDQEMTAVKVPDSVSLWKSRLHLGPNYSHGKWLPKTADKPARVRSIPFSIKRPDRDPWTLYVLDVKISRGPNPPVVLRSDARFRVRGRVDSSERLWFGVTLRHPTGGFAGRFQTIKPATDFKGGQDFDVEVRVSDFELNPELNKWKDKLPKTPVDLVVENFYCHSLDKQVGLYVTSVELIGTKQEPGDQQKTEGTNHSTTTKNLNKSIEEETKVHRLSSKKRSIFDAFTYVNRIPEKPEPDESPSDLAGRIFGRLDNQEGRVLLKLPAGMNRESYAGFKTFFRYAADGKAKVGNCAACHTLSNFTDSLNHVVAQDGELRKTPSLRNLTKRKVDIRKAVMAKIATSQQKRSGKADKIDDAYALMDIGQKDIAGLVAFLELLNDVPDAEFRKLILDAQVLDTSEDIE